MRALVVFLLAVLGWSLAEGTHLQKCDLMTHLKSAVCDPKMKAKLGVSNADDLVAKIVCKSEVATGFDTGAVKELKPGQGQSQGKSGPSVGKARGQRSPKKPHTHNPSSGHQCTLHGIFQLASHLACDNGVTPSANMCGMSCSNLEDENIQDDISCLLNVTVSLGDSFFGVKTWEEDGGQMKHVMEEKCANAQASTYFKVCPKSLHV